MAEIRDGEVGGGVGKEAHTSRAGDSRGQLLAPVAQGILKHFLTFKCMTMLLNIALPIPFSNYCIKSQRTKEFLEAKAKSLKQISQDFLQEAVFNTVITDV